MGYFAPYGVRFTGEDSQKASKEIVRAYEALRLVSKKNERELVYFVSASNMAEASRETTIAQLLPLIDEHLVSKAFRYLVWEASRGVVTESWRFIVHYESPAYIRLECDLVASTIKDGREPGLRLRRLVEDKTLDLAVCEDGYYGSPPLVFFYYRSEEIKCGIFKTETCKSLWERISNAVGTLEEMRNVKHEFIPGKRIEVWMDQWSKKLGAIHK